MEGEGKRGQLEKERHNGTVQFVWEILILVILITEHEREADKGRKTGVNYKTK